MKPLTSEQPLEEFGHGSTVAVDPIAKLLDVGEAARAQEFPVILACFALLTIEASTDPLLAAARYTIWLTYLLVGAAFVFLLWERRSPLMRSYHRVSWLSAYAVYLIHFGYTFFGTFSGSVAVFFAAQETVIASLNTLLTTWWTLDVGLVLLGARARWARIQHAVFLVILLAVAVFIGTVRKEGTVSVISVALVLVGATAILQRFTGDKAKASGATGESDT